MNISVTIKGIRMSPRKVSLVASLVRGRTVADALTILEHTPRRAAKPVAKAIASVKANALVNHRLDEKTLIIERLQITAGSRLKRFRPAAQGRALPYQKRTSHIIVTISGIEKSKKTNKPAVQPVEAEAVKKEQQ